MPRADDTIVVFVERALPLEYLEPHAALKAPPVIPVMIGQEGVGFGNDLGDIGVTGAGRDIDLGRQQLGVQFGDAVAGPAESLHLQDINRDNGIGNRQALVAVGITEPYRQVLRHFIGLRAETGVVLPITDGPRATFIGRRGADVDPHESHLLGIKVGLPAGVGADIETEVIIGVKLPNMGVSVDSHRFADASGGRHITNLEVRVGLVGLTALPDSTRVGLTLLEEETEVAVGAVQP